MLMFLESPSKGTFRGEMALLYISLPTLVSIWIIDPAFNCPGVSANSDPDAVAVVVVAAAEVVPELAVEVILDLDLVR